MSSQNERDIPDYISLTDPVNIPKTLIMHALLAAKALLLGLLGLGFLAHFAYLSNHTF